jgi:hypothetical protein
MVGAVGGAARRVRVWGRGFRVLSACSLWLSPIAQPLHPPYTHTLHLHHTHASPPSRRVTPSPNKQQTPNRKRYELCTRLGLYVVDEANLETHGFDARFQHDANHPAHSPDWTGAILERGVR